MNTGFEHGTPSQVRRAIGATRGLFAVLGVFSAVWGVHIPSVKERYALGEAVLSLVLVALAVGAVSAVMFAGRVIGRLGARQTAMACSVVMAGMLGMVLHWPGLPSLLLAMLFFGASLSVYDVAINTEGSVLETAGGRPIMGSLHGMFSLGAMGGAALAGGMLSAGVPAAWQLAGVGMAVAVCIWVGARWMLPTPPPAAQTKVHFTWPRGALLIMGLLTFAGMSAEGVMFDWCVLYLQQEVRMPHEQAALGYAACAGAMAVMRFAADRLRAHYSEQRLLQVSGTVTAVSMAGVLLVGHPVVAIVGCGLVGAGLAMIVPILYGAASRVPGTTPAAAIAAVSSIGYAGFMVGPPLIGFIAQHASLTAAMGVVVVAATILALSARFVPEKAA
ncbi:MFS transporter [Rhodoferax sp.]|uniref:MFS transporter n=1 Tax=Rhodoferax sp. TaxID=50421 RepID=UPI0025D27394|nr:MFS transporter [Rhodoferax sp.]